MSNHTAMMRSAAPLSVASAGLLLAFASCSTGGASGEVPPEPPVSAASSAPPAGESPGVGTDRPGASSQSSGSDDESESEGGSTESPDGDSDDDSAGGDGEGGASEDPPKKGAYTPDDGVLQVWTLGDSITLGVQGGFRNDLYNLLAADGYAVDMVGTQYDDSTEIADKDHEGHVAWTIQKTLDDVDGWLAQITPPDVVILWLGANDLAWWTNMTPAEHVSDFETLIDHLIAILPSHATIVVSSLAPQSSTIVESVGLDRSQMSDDFNEELRDRIPDHPLYGERVYFADLRPTLSLDDLYDGIHPTREAHARIAGVFYDVLAANLGL
jgi:lysophospholipase L1-like esterase